jgi:hypothetical protein
VRASPFSCFFLSVVHVINDESCSYRNAEHITSVAVGDIMWGAIPCYFRLLQLLTSIIQQVFEWHLRQNVMADVVENKNQDHRAGLPFKVTHKVNNAVMECSYTVVKANPAVSTVI